MVDKQITDLTSGGALTDADLFLSRQNGTTEDKKVTSLQMKTYVVSSLTTDDITEGSTNLYFTPDNYTGEGTNSVILGNGASLAAENENDVAIGHDAHAGDTLSTKNFNVAVGADSRAIGTRGTAVGYFARATDVNATALGDSAHASGNKSCSLGNDSDASGQDAISIKGNASGDYSVAVGSSATATAEYAMSFGRNSNATHAGAICFGFDVDSTAADQVLFGEKYVTLGNIATASLASASDHEGAIVYDSTTSTVKFSDGTSWANISSGGGGGGGGEPSDGDKGDIIVSSSGATWTIDNGVVTVAKISATGTASSSTFLRGEGSWAAPAGGGGGDLLAANNLSDLDNAATARTNLGLAIGTDVQAHSAVLDATTASYTTAEETKLSGIATGAEVNTIDSDPTGVTGADQVTNVMSLTQAEYDAITPNASTLYIITDAT